MRLGTPATRARVRALVLVAVLATGCTNRVEDRSLHRKDAAEEWQDEFNRAQSLERGAMFEPAEKRYRRALRAAREFPSDDPREARTRLALADLYTVQGRIDEAEAEYRVVIGIQRAAYGERNEAIADSLNRLGVLYADHFEAAKAEPLFEEALRIRISVYGDEHPATIATAQNLASAYRETGRFQEAEVLYLQALRFYAERGEAYFGIVSVVENNLALLYQRMGRGAEAESLHMGALETSIAINGPRNPNVARFFRDLANLFAEQRRFGESERTFLDAIKIFIENYGQSHYELRRTYLDLAAMLVAAGRERDAGYYRSLAEAIPPPTRFGGSTPPAPESRSE